MAYRSTRGWYRRNDRNGWRAVAPLLLLNPEQHSALAKLVGPALHAAQVARSKPSGRRQQRAWQQGGRADFVEDLSWGSSDNDYGAARARRQRRLEPPTHYSRLVRRDERTRRLKQRRREWLLKLHRQGLLQPADAAWNQQGLAPGANLLPAGADAPVEETRPSAAVGRAAVNSRDPQGGTDDEVEALMAELEQRLQLFEARQQCGSNGGPGNRPSAANPAEAGDGEDVLLQWCQALDFEAYAHEWVVAACTAASEAGAERLRAEGDWLAQLVAAQQAAEEAVQEGEGGDGAQALQWPTMTAGVRG